MPPIVDAHVHLFDYGFLPPGWHDATAWRWSARTFPPRDPSVVRDRIEEGLVDPDGSLLKAELDRVGLDAAVCIALDWEIALGPQAVPLEQVHEHYRQIQAGQRGSLMGRFFAVAGLDPRREGALELLHHLLTDGGFKGYKLYPPCGYHPYDDVCHPFLRLCRELGRPVVIHSAPSGYPMRTRFAHPYGVNDVQTAFPELTLVLAHAGHGGWGVEARAMAARHPNTYLELSNYNDDIDHDPDGTAQAILAMRDAVGAHRLIFGSDHFGGRRFSGRDGLPRWIDFIRELPKRAVRLGSSMSDEEVDLILGENARRVFKLDLGAG